MITFYHAGIISNRKRPLPAVPPQTTCHKGVLRSRTHISVVDELTNLTPYLAVVFVIVVVTAQSY